MVVRNRKLKDRQYNDQMTKGQTMIYKTTQKTKDWATQKTGVELRWSDTSAHQMICEDRHFTHMLKTLHDLTKLVYYPHFLLQYLYQTTKRSSMRVASIFAVFSSDIKTILTIWYFLFFT